MLFNDTCGVNFFIDLQMIFLLIYKYSLALLISLLTWSSAIHYRRVELNQFIREIDYKNLTNRTVN